MTAILYVFGCGNLTVVIFTNFLQFLRRKCGTFSGVCYLKLANLVDNFGCQADRIFEKKTTEIRNGRQIHFFQIRQIRHRFPLIFDPYTTNLTIFCRLDEYFHRSIDLSINIALSNLLVFVFTTIGQYFENWYPIEVRGFLHA